jgi:hypothetical protein
MGWGIRECSKGLTLQEVGCSLPHPRVDICFRGLDVIMEIVSERLDVRDDVGHPLRGEVAGEQD